MAPKPGVFASALGMGPGADDEEVAEDDEEDTDDDALLAVADEVRASMRDGDDPERFRDALARFVRLVRS